MVKQEVAQLKRSLFKARETHCQLVEKVTTIEYHLTKAIFKGVESFK